MDTVKSIFNNKLLRIPDYQRGYSWDRSNLDDFWQDLINLQSDKVHYTGMISVELVDKIEYENWNEDTWIIEGRGDKAYFIVDGQQRLTTIIILIWVVCQRMPEGSQLNYLTKQQIIDKYIFTVNSAAGQKSFLFGYHRDNPSYEFLKREIFEQDPSDNSPQIEETVYTNNLLNAKRYFIEKTKKLTLFELEALFQKLTQQLMFDFKILEKELDIFIVFETMNNRGKPLSNLEKLKNRLIYLSTLLPNENSDRKIELRSKINEHWKTIYKYLGFNKEQRLDDDSFLQNHWIMFARYDRREPEFYAKDLFERYYTSQNVISGKEGFNSISNYIESVAEGAKQWFLINSPSHPHALEIAESRQIITWLRKLNRLGVKSFAPLILAALLTESDKAKVTKLLRTIEAYIFLIFYVSFKRSNTGTYHFFTRANELYSGDATIESVIEDISLWIYGKKDVNGYFDIDGFYSYLRDLFLRDNTSGYYDWKFLRYFLFEYDVSLQRQHELPNNWSGLNSVQQIYPSKPILTCWKNSFRSYSPQQRKFLAGSLGNFILVNSAHDFDQCFEDKKELFGDFANTLELKNVPDWNDEQILKRGIHMLNFMENRWNVELGTFDEKARLLFLDFTISARE
ncbi:MAG: DUF262 domain-containing protein [Dyadobacter sp.]|uniref:DUF262 domain-containing protein n=1 Tax=Dyadobacter sp. TaxID=1914288 RepID=UPI003264F492